MPNDGIAEPRGVTRRLVRWLVKRYYPHVEITGADRIPQSGPVLLCANHANALLDPVLIGIAARRPVRFMAKAPLFDHPILGPPMSALGMIPAFRSQDDAREVRRNLESLDVGAKVLIEGHAMGIFPERVSTDHAHLAKVRSGAARMAIQAVEEGAAGLKVVPIGISYERKDRFRSSVWLQVGDPIDVRECLDEHGGDGRKARRALTAQLETQSAVSTWIGDFKIREPRRGEPLIHTEQLAKLAAVLEPGDVLLERRNWYLSNAFLPGYWPHGALYVGTADDLRERGLDQNEYVRKHWEEFSAKDDEGHRHVIIEAVSEGVIVSSLEHSIGGADCRHVGNVPHAKNAWRLFSSSPGSGSSIVVRNRRIP